MVHTVIVNGRSYDLPKKTISIASKLDEVLKTDAIRGLSVRQKYEKLHEFTKDVLGEETAKEVMAKDSTKAVMLAVKGMLPKNSLGRKMLTKLRVYKGSEHEQAAQKPEVYNF